MGTPVNTLRILHISDLHVRSASKEQPFGSARVPDAFLDYVKRITEHHPIDIVAFTGDVAQSGVKDEYDAASRFFGDLLKGLGLPRSRLFVVPGNHDIHRNTEADLWNKLRRIAALLPNSVIDKAMAGFGDLPDIEDGWRQKILSRQRAYQNWLAEFRGDDALRPSNSPHKYLGYRHTLPFETGSPVHIIGLDSAWFAGDDGDHGQLMLTTNQIGKLLSHNRERKLDGLSVALMHHPLYDLRDQAESTTMLARYADIVLRGHEHSLNPVTVANPDGSVRVFSVGCLYSGVEYPNKFQVLTISRDGVAGRACFHAWSGDHWYRDSGAFENAPEGCWDWPTHVVPPPDEPMLTEDEKRAIAEKVSGLGVYDKTRQKLLDETPKPSASVVLTFTHFSRERIKLIQAAALRERFYPSSRSLLFAHMSAYMDALPVHDSPRTQLFSDLNHMNGIERWAQNTEIVPLAAWLEEAVALAEDAPNLALFKRHLEEMQTR